MRENYPLPERKELRSIEDILTEFRNKVTEFVPPHKIAFALAALAAIGAGCAKDHGTGVLPPPPTATYGPAVAGDDADERQGYQQEQTAKDNTQIDTLREQIKRDDPPKEEVHHLQISETNIREACDQKIEGQFTLKAVNVLNSNGIACAFVERPAEGASENEEQFTYEALLFHLNESGGMSFITQFPADTFDTPRYEMKHNPDVTAMGLTVDELTWLIQNPPENGELITIK
jgi:hypothetical protein